MSASSRRPWSVSEDLLRAQSWLYKQWRGESLHWDLEVRTEQFGVGTMRLGELVIKGSPTGILTLAIRETHWDTTGD